MTNISDLRNKVSKKVYAFCRVTGYMSLEKSRTVIKRFLESQLNDCPLIWMLHSRTLNKKINRLHERALRIVYSDYKLSFTAPFGNIQSVAVEIYKFFHDLSPAIMGNIIKLNKPHTHNLRTL